MNCAIQILNFAIYYSIVQYNTLLYNVIMNCAMVQVGGLSSVSGLSLPLGPVTRLSAGNYSYICQSSPIKSPPQALFIC